MSSMHGGDVIQCHIQCNLLLEYSDWLWFGSVSLESGFYHRDLCNRSRNKTNWETLIFSWKYSGLDILLDSGTCTCITIWNFLFLSHLRPFWKFLPGGLFFQCCSLHVVHITSSCRKCTPQFPDWKLDHLSLTDWNWKHKYYHHILMLVSCDGSSETQTQTKKIKSNQIDSAATLCITSHTLCWHSAFLP